jgi:hypothetical protein
MHDACVAEDGLPPWQFWQESSGCEKPLSAMGDLLKSEYESPLNATVASTVLGRSAFIRDVAARHLGEKRAERSMPAVKALALSAFDG